MKRKLLIFLLTSVSLLLGACSEKDTVKQNPYLVTSTRAMLKEVVEVKFRNIGESTMVSVDFGDGTIKEAPASETITHSYMESGDYTMLVKAGQYELQKRIRIYDLLALTEAMKQFDDTRYKKIWVMTHRGQTTDFSIPENSISAVEASIESGAEIIETDTQITKDGVVVICHDETIDRTTNGKGKIPEMTYEEIQQYFLKDRNGNVTTEKMPTLEEFLKAGRGKVYFDLDYPSRTASTAQIFRTVSDLDMLEQVFFYSTSQEQVNELLAYDKGVHAYPWVGHHKPLVNLPGRYFVQSSYLTMGGSTNVSSAINDGMLISVNLLATTGSDVNHTELKDEWIDGLLATFPMVKMIHTEVPELLIEALEKRGLR